MQGSGLDSYAKQWRLFADCFNNVGKLCAYAQLQRMVGNAYPSPKARC